MASFDPVKYKAAMQVEQKSLLEFSVDLLIAAGVDRQEAPIIAQSLVWMNLAGRDTQGVARLPAYLKRLALGLIASPCNPELIRKSDTTWIVNGRHGFGHYLGHLAMLKAVEIATQHGVGLVGVRESNHFGAAAYYAELAAQRGQIGLALSNSVPLVAPPGGVAPVLGTNPFAFAAPVKDGHSILVDFSTAMTAGSVLRKAIEDNQPIPEGVVIDAEGNPTTNLQDATNGVLLPFGGAKGFCLGLMVEILSGVMTGAAISHEIASLYKDFSKQSNLGHLFIAIDIAKLMPLELYFDRMDVLLSFLKGVKKQHGVDEIHIPGENRWQNRQRQLQDGIALDSKAIKSLNELANRFGVATRW